MEEPIRKEDIIDVAGTISDLDKLIFKFGEVIVVMKRFEKEGAGAVIRSMTEANTATKEGQMIIAQGVDQAAAIDAQKKERAKIEKEYLQLIARRNELEGEGAKINAQLKVENQKRTQALNAEAKASNAAGGSVNRMRADLKKLTEEYNNLDKAAAKKAAPAVRKLSDELKKAESAIGNNTRNVGNYLGSLKKMGTAILAATGITAGFAGTLKIGKEIIESTDALSDKFAATLNGWKEGFASMARAIANNDFKDFFKNVKAAVTEGQRFTETQEAIADSARALAIRISEGETEILNLRNDMVKSGVTAIQQAEIGANIQKKLDENAADRVKIAELTLANDMQNAAFKAKTSEIIVKAYLDQDEALLKNIKTGEKYNELQKRLKSISLPSGGTAPPSAAQIQANIDEKKAINEKLIVLGSEAIAYGALATGLANITDAQKDKIVADYEAIESAKQSAINLRVTSKLATAEAKVDKAAIVASEKNTTDEIVGTRLERANKIMEIDKTSLGSFRLLQERSLETIENIGKLIDESEEGSLARQKVRAEAEIELNRATAESKMNIASGVADFLNAIAGKNKAIQYAALIADKALAIAEVIIQTQKANAALRAWGALGGPAGLILATGGIVKNNIAAVIGIAAIGAAAAMGIAGISKSAKMAKGGSGILDGPSHQRGGINVGIGEAEGGEHIAVTSRKMTNRYGSKMLDAVSNSINQGKFFEVWANVNKEMSSDPYTKKMYELMERTPTVYNDTNGDTVKEYPNGQKYVIKRFYKN